MCDQNVKKLILTTFSYLVLFYPVFSGHVYGRDDFGDYLESEFTAENIEGARSEMHSELIAFQMLKWGYVETKLITGNLDEKEKIKLEREKILCFYRDLVKKILAPGEMETHLDEILELALRDPKSFGHQKEQVQTFATEMAQIIRSASELGLLTAQMSENAGKILSQIFLAKDPKIELAAKNMALLAFAAVVFETKAKDISLDFFGLQSEQNAPVLILSSKIKSELSQDMVDQLEGIYLASLDQYALDDFISAKGNTGLFFDQAQKAMDLLPKVERLMGKSYKNLEIMELATKEFGPIPEVGQYYAQAKSRLPPLEDDLANGQLEFQMAIKKVLKSSQARLIELAIKYRGH